MWRAARDSVCLFCRSAATRPRTGLESSQIWTEQRTFATIRGGRGRDGAGNRRPSRMVLSDRVARPPPSPRDGDDGPGGSGGGSRRSRNQVDGPFAGMNRTTANIRPRPAARLAPAPTSTSRHKREDNDRRGKGGEKPSFKALKMQRALTTIGYGERNKVKARIHMVESFDQFPLLPVIKDAIVDLLGKGRRLENGIRDIVPTPIQKLAIPALLGKPLIQPKFEKKTNKSDARKDHLLAAETGSGKTLAYLLPAINALKAAGDADPAVQAYNQRLAEEKERRGDVPVSKWIERFEPHPETARPRVIVLVPTAELVAQVTSVAKSLSHVAKIKVRPISSNFSAEKIQRNMYSNMGVDLVVATPHLLASMATSDPNILSRVTHLIIDEADSLLDRSFAPETTQIIDRTIPSLKQLVMCSATIPRRLDNFLTDRFPLINRLTTPSLHAVPRRVQLGVIDVTKDPYRNNKNLACADAIWSIGKDSMARNLDTTAADTRRFFEQEMAGHSSYTPPSPEEEADPFIHVNRIMVFVNEREKTVEVAEYLQSKGIDAIALHRDSPDHRQSEMLSLFTNPDPVKVPAPTDPTSAKGPLKRRLLNTKVLVATDIASRGIDTLAVRHVVLYDVPHTTIDFIHRLGRAGRMKRRGRGIVLVGKDDRKDVVAEVKESMFMGQALV